MIPWRFFVRLAIIYIAVVVLVVLAISPYFSVGWDPQIFAGVGRAVLDGQNPFGLYQASRAVWGDWGFPYPPLYAHLVAPAIGATLAAPALPDWITVRAVPVIFDLVLSVLIYLLVLKRSREERLARLGATLWLLNPLTLYQTAIQAHQESSWLACVVAAFAVADGLRARPIENSQRLAASAFVPSLLMACAVTMKQSAIMLYVPYAVFLLLEREHRLLRLITAGALFAVVFGGMSLPYLLHSQDFFYLVFIDVPNMPVQTQSAVVWLLGLREYLVEQTRSTFFLLQNQAAITLALTLAMSALVLRKDRDLLRLGLMTVLLFFLTSKKVMGYHYPMLVPFLLIYALPQRRFDLVAIAMTWASWVVVSPYFAPWARPEHLALYAAIGTPNTLLWLWLLAHVWLRRDTLRLGQLDVTARLQDGSAALLTLAAITAGMVLCCLLQPWGSAALPIQVAMLVAVLIASLLLALVLVRRLWQPAARLTPGHVVIAALLVPVYMAAFTLTLESTQIIENLLS